MQSKVYEIGKNGQLVESVAKFNDLTPGTVIEWGGNYGFPQTKFCILSRTVSPRDGDVTYTCYNLDNPEKNANLHRVEARSIKAENDPALWHSQHYFIQDEILGIETVELYRAHHEELKQAHDARQAAAKAEADRLEAIGRELWPVLIGECPAIIVAELHVSDCDGMTDYYASHTTQRVILAPSKHKRDLFPEFRKAAGKIPETRHMATAPEKPADADEWWKPADEHREKYSMGAGFYLSDGGTYSGWHVEKQIFWKGTPQRDDYICLAKRYDHLQEQKPEPKPEPKQETTPATPSTGTPAAYTVSYDRDWTWIKFPGKPAESVLAILRKEGNFSRRRMAWYYTRHMEEAEVAALFATPAPAAAPAPIAEPETADDVLIPTEIWLSHEVPA